MTKIEWTDETWNPLIALRRDTGKRGWHCEKISPACDNCYAAAMNKRSDGLVGIGTGLNYAPDQLPKVDIAIHQPTLQAPLKWRHGRYVFVCSMTDLFGHWHTDKMIARVFSVMAKADHHIFQVLTKRPKRMRNLLMSREFWASVYGYDLSSPEVEPREGLLPNVWLGATVENQEQYDERIDWLCDTPAAKHFISYEPALGPIRIDFGFDRIDWVIMGGESGREARPMNPNWARSMRDQCHAANVPFFFKQWGEYAQLRAFNGYEQAKDLPLFYVSECGKHVADGRKKDVDLVPGGRYQPVYRVGKERAGRLLDEKEYSEFPDTGAE